MILSLRQTGDAADRANFLPWPPILLVGVAALAAGLGHWWPLGWPGTDDTAARAIGLSFGVAGGLLIGFAVRALTRAGTTVLPDQKSSVLVTSGPYGFFRNPMYLGWVLLLLATAELTKNIWFAVAAAVFGVLVTALQILPEERHLLARFGDAYGDYKARTRRWI